jgi:hypothetical protein
MDEIFGRSNVGGGTSAVQLLMEIAPLARATA